MTPNPILRVLSTFKKHNVKCLLIGGQACIIYGAAEFSRDSDFVIFCTHRNLKNLKNALNDLRAEPVYVPPLKIRYLKKGHACHFRCKRKDVSGLRIDVISKLRGCDSFSKLWKRKNTITLKNGTKIDVIGIGDLVQSKKTQRDKDWLMLKRLVENDIILCKNPPSAKRLKWWFCECRNASMLINLAKKYPEIARECRAKRPLLFWAINSNAKELNLQLQHEEFIERQKDIEYWAPLKRELETLRHHFLTK